MHHRGAYEHDPRNKIRRCLELHRYRISKHAIERRVLRDIVFADIRNALLHGYHEKEKTLFDVASQTWKYAIRGKTLDGVEIRVIIAFEQEMVIITVMKLVKK